MLVCGHLALRLPAGRSGGGGTCIWPGRWISGSKWNRGLRSLPPWTHMDHGHGSTTEVGAGENRTRGGSRDEGGANQRGARRQLGSAAAPTRHSAGKKKHQTGGTGRMHRATVLRFAVASCRRARFLLSGGARVSSSLPDLKLMQCVSRARGFHSSTPHVGSSATGYLSRQHYRISPRSGSTRGGHIPPELALTRHDTAAPAVGSNACH